MKLYFVIALLIIGIIGILSCSDNSAIQTDTEPKLTYDQVTTMVINISYDELLRHNEN